jgi:hypothetical protein
VDNAVADGHDIQEEVMFPHRAPSPLSIETLSWTKNQTLFAAYFPGNFASSHCKPDYILWIVTESWASQGSHGVDDGDVIDVLAGCRSCDCGQHNCPRGQCRRGRP